MPDLTPSIDGNKEPPARRRLWLWFLTGFLVVFGGFAVLFPANFYDGRTVRRTSVLHYYLLEIQLASSSTGAIGPTSGNSAAAVNMAMQHVAFSAFAGVVVMCIGHLTRKRSP